MSDSIVYRPIKYKIIFGPQLLATMLSLELLKQQAQSLLTTRLKTQVVKLYRNIRRENWGFMKRLP